jgi:hypothetical protein
VREAALGTSRGPIARYAILERDVELMALGVRAQGAALLLLCLAGCAVLPDYPVALPELAPADTRAGVSPDISGRYADRGHGFSPEGEPVGEMSLTRLLGVRASDGSVPADAELVVITGPAHGRLELQAFHGDRLLAGLRHAESDAASVGSTYPGTYAGNRGFVLLPVETAHGGAPGVGGYGTDQSLWLRKATDGSLVVLHRTVGAGVIVLLPVWRSSGTWYRFPVAAPSSTDSASP